MKRNYFFIAALSIISISYALNAKATPTPKNQPIRAIENTGLTQNLGIAYRIIDRNTDSIAGAAHCMARIQNSPVGTFLDLQIFDDRLQSFEGAPSSIPLNTNLTIKTGKNSLEQEATLYRLPLRRDKSVCPGPFQEARIQYTLLINDSSIEIQREMNLSRCDALKPTYGELFVDSVICSTRP